MSKLLVVAFCLLVLSVGLSGCISQYMGDIESSGEADGLEEPIVSGEPSHNPTSTDSTGGVVVDSDPTVVPELQEYMPYTADTPLSDVLDRPIEGLEHRIIDNNVVDHSDKSYSLFLDMPDTAYDKMPFFHHFEYSPRTVAEIASPDLGKEFEARYGSKIVGLEFDRMLDYENTDMLEQTNDARAAGNRVVANYASVEVEFANGDTKNINLPYIGNDLSVYLKADLGGGVESDVFIQDMGYFLNDGYSPEYFKVAKNELGLN